MKFISNVRLLLIGAWLGAACFFSFAVAPGAFSILENRELAGSLVSRTLMIVNLSGLAFGLILLLSSFIKRQALAPIWVWMERFLLVLFTLACAVGEFVISVWLKLIRSQAGRPIGELAAEDPVRMQFNSLHQYSVWIMLGAMIAALLLFFLTGKGWDKTAAVENKDEFKF
jgi:Domain of unknown function (DUF4149)